MSINQQETINRIRQGDLSQFEKVFRHYYPLLCRYAMSFVKDMDQAHEVVQELFYQLWKNHKHLQIHSSLKAYLYRSTYNNCLQYIRKRNIEQVYQKKLSQQQNHPWSPLEVMHQQQVSEIIEQTLDSLPLRCRQIFKMSRFEGLKYREIADQLSISIKTVEANMGKALKTFRERLKDYVGIIIF